MRAWTGFEMAEWAGLIDEINRLRSLPVGPWSLNCDRGGCPGLMHRNVCRSCGRPR